MTKSAFEVYKKQNKTAPKNQQNGNKIRKKKPQKSLQKTVKHAVTNGLIDLQNEEIARFSSIENQQHNHKIKVKPQRRNSLKKKPIITENGIDEDETPNFDIEEEEAPIIEDEAPIFEEEELLKVISPEQEPKKKRRRHRKKPVNQKQFNESIGKFVRPPSSDVEDTNSDDEDFDLKPLEAFQYMMAPMNQELFFEKYWEKLPLHIVRNIKSDYYSQLLSSQKLDFMLRNNPLYYTKNVDVVTYENGERQTHNPEGRALPDSVWDYYGNGCSVRILNPQTYNKKIRSLLAMLQEYFGTMAGANVYLTPPGSQGFAPHFDDIEAFVLQIEGRKHWKIYKPQTEDLTLPRYSSRNLNRDELGEPEELTLEAGDLLYFPRGFIHEAYTDNESHSLHITVSVYQNTAYVDLIEKLLTETLRTASASNIEYRQGLPLQYLKHIGVANADSNSPVRREIISTVKDLMGQLANYVNVDQAADQLGRKFMYDALPPQLSDGEKRRSSKEDGLYLVDGALHNVVNIEPDTQVRLVRYHCMRLAVEEGVNKIYYCTENSNVYHGEEEQVLELSDDMVDTVKALVHNYPKYVKVEDLPSQDQVGQMHAIGDFWERGLIVTKEPLTGYDDE